MESNKRDVSQPWRDFFAFGFWRHAGHPYQGGIEGQMRWMRRMSMNTLLAFPDVTKDGSVEDQVAKVREALATAGRFGIRIMPYCQTTVERLAAVAGEFKDEPAILGWYIRDEPNPDFLPTFLEYKAAIEATGAKQPVVCLFYRGDSTSDFAPHQPMLLSDVYPLGYVHQTSSLGPHFGHHQSHEHFLNYDMGKFLPFGNRGVHDWLELCRTYCRDMPHWLTLGAFEGANGKAVRWREPTINEMKLQVYQAVAAGVTGITYYLYSLVIDNYGLPFEHHHGEKTPMSQALVEIGAEVTPLARVLTDTKPEHEGGVLATWRPTPEPARGVEIRRLRSTVGDAHFLVAVNNDVLVTQTGLAHLDGEFVGDREVFDLTSLKPVEPQPHVANGVAFELQIRPGHGRVYSVCTREEFERQKQAILQGRCENEIAQLDMEWNLLEASKVDLSGVADARRQFEGLLEKGDFGEALAAVRICAAALRDAAAADEAFSAFRIDLESSRLVMGQMTEQRPLFHPNHAVARKDLSEIFAELEKRFWDGRYESCRDAAAGLAKMLNEFALQRAARCGVDDASPDLDEAEIARLKSLLAS